MKFSALFTVTVVLLIFLAIQGWVVKARVLSPDRVTVAEAHLEAQQADIRSPVPGIVHEVKVQEGETVEKGQTLFTVRPQYGVSASGKAVAITAPFRGVVSSVTATRGTFVQVDTMLSRLTDTSSENLRIEATLRVSPEDLTYVRPTLMATVESDSLEDGDPVRAVVTAVDPEYDAENQTILVHMRFLEEPEQTGRVTVGLPVRVTFRDGGVTSFAARFRSFLPGR